MAEVDLAHAFGLAPEAAMAYFRSKGYTFSWNWEDVREAAHAKGFTVAKALRLDVLQDIRAAVDKALAEGQTLERFRRELMPELIAKGWWGKVAVGDDAGGRTVQLGSPWRLRTIYQANLQTAYMAGRYKSQIENAEARPYWQYIAVLDGRTRPAHRALHGRVFRYDDSIWKSFYPPNGWGCRCRVRALSAADVAIRGLTVESSVGKLSFVDRLVSEKTGEMRQVAVFRTVGLDGKETTVSPDVGWSYNPGAAAFDPFVPRPLDADELVGGYKTVGAQFHDKPAIDSLPAKPVTPGMLLPLHQESGWSEARYIDRFLEEFKTTQGRPVVFEDAVGDPLVVSEELFRDRAAGRLKVWKADREAYLLLLADTIKDPVEIWLTWVDKGDGAVRICKRYIGIYRGEDKKIGGFVVFDLVDGMWQGTTAFKPKNLGYLDEQRRGTLLYTKKEAGG